MASKEVTTFVVDLSPAMANKNHDRTISDLDYGLKYFNDVILSKIIKHRKTDFISVVLCHSENTANIFATDDEFTNIETINTLKLQPPSYSDLKTYQSKMVPNIDEIKHTEGDIFAAFMIALGTLQPTFKNKYIRNIVVITNGETSTKYFDSPLVDSIVDPIIAGNVKVVVVGIDFDINDFNYDGSSKSETKILNEKHWRKQLARYPDSCLITNSQLEEAINDPPTKTIKPTAIFNGQLRFGADLMTNQEYDSLTDPLSIAFRVQAYHGVKRENLQPTKRYILQNGIVYETQSVYDYYMKEKADGQAPDDPEQEDNIVELPVDKHDRINGFRFTYYDLTELTPDLKEASQLKTEPGIDICGFILKDDLPLSYLTENALYIFPSQIGVSRDIIGFNSLVESLIVLKSYAIARYVQKQNAEVQMTVLIPVEFDTHSISSKRNDDKLFGLCMIRLPFAEDEKMKTFMKLVNSNATDTEAGDKDASIYPTADNIQLMESFVLGMDLDEDLSTDLKSNEDQITIPLFASSQYSQLPLPKPVNKPMTLTERLTPSNPGIFHYNKQLKQIVISSIESDKPLTEFLEKVIIPSDYMPIEDIFKFQSKEQNFFDDLAGRLQVLALQIKKDFGVKYLEFEKAQKEKEKNQQEEVAYIYDDVNDMDEWL